MSKSIPVALQSHLDLYATTTCYLLRIAPRFAEGSSPPPAIGMTTLDQDVVYNDGSGSLTYSAPGGFVPSSALATGDFAVDTAEAEILIPAASVGPMIEADINAGRYDFAPFTLYRVNYNDLTTGRHEVVMHGTIGQMRIVNGLAVVTELRSMLQSYRQSVCELDSITCRTEFGSAACGYDANSLWVYGTVTGVGDELDRVFGDTHLAEADGYFAPGIVEWISGNNAGRSYEVEAFDSPATSPSSPVVSLTFPTAFDIQVGDSYRIRKDCNKQARHATKGCKFFWDTDWGLHFRGEPDIPVGDEAALNTPNAASPSPNRRRPVDDVYNPPPPFDEIPAIDNGGFESGDLTGWTAIAGAAGWSVVSTDPGEGTYSLKYDPVTGGVATGVIRSDYQSFLEGDTLTGSALVKLGWTTTDSDYAAAVNGMTPNSTAGGATSRADDWTRIGWSQPHRNASGDTQAAIRLTAYTDGTNPVFFDDVRFTVG